MKAWIVSIIFVLVSFLIETSALSIYAGISLPLSLMALIFCALKYGEFVGQIMGFVLGFLVDLVAGTPLGFSVLSYLTIGFIVGLWHKESFVSSWFWTIAFFLVARLILAIFSLLLAVFFSADPWESIGWAQNFWLGLIFCPLYISLLNVLDTLLSGKKVRVSEY